MIDVFTADGNGNGSEVETISFNGAITTGATFTVTYTVNADCTGSFVSTGLGSTFHNAFVIDDNKKEIRLMPTEPGFVAVCIYRKQWRWKAQGTLHRSSFQTERPEIGALRPDIKCPGYAAPLAEANSKAPFMGRCTVARRVIAG